MFWSLGDMYALCMGVECGLQIIQTKGTCGSALMLLIFNMYKTGLVVGKLVVQGVLALCKFHYCGFSKLLL